MATHSSVLAWRIPGMGEPRGLPSMGLHRVGHDWSDLAAAGAKRNVILVGQVKWKQIQNLKGSLELQPLRKEFGHGVIFYMSLYKLSSCYMSGIILLCHCDISHFKDKKVMTIGSCITLLNIVPIPCLCQFGLYFFRCMLEISPSPLKTPEGRCFVFIFSSLTESSQYCALQIVGTLFPGGQLPWKMVLMLFLTSHHSLTQ